MEAAKASLMPVGQLPTETVEERLMEARRTYKLNLGQVHAAADACSGVLLLKSYQHQPRVVVDALACMHCENWCKAKCMELASICSFLPGLYPYMRHACVQVCRHQRVPCRLCGDGEEVQPTHHRAGAVQVQRVGRWCSTAAGGLLSNLHVMAATPRVMWLYSTAGAWGPVVANLNVVVDGQGQVEAKNSKGGCG